MELPVISTKNLRDNLAEILEQVAIGQKSFIVSKFGRKKVLISPITALKTTATDFNKLSAFGIWKDRKDMRDPIRWVAESRQKQSLRKQA